VGALAPNATAGVASYHREPVVVDTVSQYLSTVTMALHSLMVDTVSWDLSPRIQKSWFY